MHDKLFFVLAMLTTTLLLGYLVVALLGPVGHAVFALLLVGLYFHHRPPANAGA